MPPDRRTLRIYPDLVAAGSLGAALDDAFAHIACPLKSSRQFFGKDSSSFASVDSGNRFAQIYIAAYERKFALGIWEENIEMATGWARELSDVAAAIQTVLEHAERKVSELVEGVPFLRLESTALSYERGTYVEDKWQRFLNDPLHEGGEARFLLGGNADVDPIGGRAPRASPTLALHKHDPFLRLADSGLSRHHHPGHLLRRERAVWAQPYLGGPALVEGEAAVVLDALIEHIAIGEG